MVSRFTIHDGSHPVFDLKESLPWAGVPLEPNGGRLRIGMRKVGRVTNVGGAKTQLAGSAIGSGEWLMKGNLVRVSAKVELEDDFYGWLALDLWMERPGETASDVGRAWGVLWDTYQTVLARVEQIAGAVGSDFVGQEFLEIRLPRFLSQLTDSDKVKARLAALDKEYGDKEYYFRNEYPTVKLEGRQLRLGPEPEGVIKAAQRFLEEETGNRAHHPDPTPAEQRRRWRIPMTTAAVLLGTWFFPNKIWSISLVSLMLLGLLASSVYPARKIGWRAIFRDPTTIATVGFFGIGVFGIGYAICAMVDDEAIGHVTRLGYPFLVSTGLGVAGGILGDNPKGFALVWAHVQLLLFLSGLMSAIIAVVGIARDARDRRDR
jgi:hypothetical protein